MTTEKDVRILLADDSASDKISFRKLLNEINPSFVFLQAKDGIHAIMQPTAYTTIVPNRVFLDINMPHMNGVETLAAINTYYNLKDTPFIMFSSGGLNSYSDKAKEFCSSSSLTNAVNMHDNLNEIKLIIEKIITHERNAS